MNDPITVYRDGRFVTEEAPEWWWAEFDRIHPESAERASSVRGITYGNIERISITCWCLTGSRGRWLECEDGSGVTVDLWLPTQADWLDFLITRAPAFLGLSHPIRLAA